ncbi:MAG: hypothetical protein AAB361_00360 [Patescibacteria group bacterium]
MAKKIAARKDKILVLYESREIKIYKEGGNVVFSYVDCSNDEDGSNNSFCEVVKEDIFKNAIVDLLRTGNCALSEYLEFELKKAGKKLIIRYLISDCQTVYLIIDNFNLSQLFF